jgi:DNA polymerase
MTFEELRQECLACHKCELGRTRTNVVFGAGDEHADIMFVGEGPGKNEDEQGLPFVGQAGKLLDTYLTAVGLDRAGVYIANIVKCRPPGNRDPLPAEQDSCIGWLEKQLELVSPKIVVCLGRISAKRLIDGGFRVTVDHGRIYERERFKMMGTFHPAALLRNPASKIPAFEDFKSLAELVGAI